MLSVQIQGVVKRVFPQYRRGKSVIEEILLLIDGQSKYPSELHIEVRNNKISDFDLVVGDNVILAISIYAIEIEGRIYNKAVAWGCTKIKKQKINK